MEAEATVTATAVNVQASATSNNDMKVKAVTAITIASGDTVVEVKIAFFALDAETKAVTTKYQCGGTDCCQPRQFCPCILVHM